VHLHNVNLHTMPSVEPPITDGEDAPPIAASPIADAPPVAAGAAADDAASDEDSLSSEVSRRGGERALTSEALLRAVDGVVDVDEGADSNRNNAETENAATTQQQQRRNSSDNNNAATTQQQQQQQQQRSNSKDNYNNKQRYKYHDLRQEGEQVRLRICKMLQWCGAEMKMGIWSYCVALFCSLLVVIHYTKQHVILIKQTTIDCIGIVFVVALLQL
jgi:hypothetical protein